MQWKISIFTRFFVLMFVSCVRTMQWKINVFARFVQKLE